MSHGIRSGVSWTQFAYIKASNTDASDGFGSDVGLTHDGSVLAVGAEREASAAIGVNQDQNDEGAPQAGAAYVFRTQSP